MSLVVLVPVLARPWRVQTTLDAFNTTVPDARVLFIATPGDQAEQKALVRADADVIYVDGTYPTKIRAGLEHASSTLVFTGADDIVPQKGWFQAARSKMADPIQVVGVNDMIDRRREHATHFLMTREYAQEPLLDGSPGPFCDEYFHWRVDDELIATAKKRGVYAYAGDSYCRHDHPMVNRAPDDPTYQLGRMRVRQDNRVFLQRERLWT